MDAEAFDTELFLGEVEKRRCIWYMECPDYRENRVLKKEQRLTEGPKEDDDKLFCLTLYTELQNVPGHGLLRTKIQLLEELRRAQEFYDPSRNHPAPQSYHSYQAHSSLAPPQTFNQLRVLSANKPTSPNTRKFLRAHRLQQSISRCSSSEHTLFPIFASMSSPFANGQ
ncbi:hypothetical protein J6590_084007 [Homalodisca vitripennis]|nr:hypothetical protein J6590_084007 [Homalodisca vitripennis]